MSTATSETTSTRRQIPDRLGTPFNSSTRGIQQKQRRALTGLRRDDQLTGLQATQNQAFFAVQHIVRALAFGPSTQLLRIEQGRRLTHGNRRQWCSLLADKGRQPARLLLGAGPATNAVGRGQRHQQGNAVTLLIGGKLRGAGCLYRARG